MRSTAPSGIDLDNFTQINDRFDHAVGDMVLRAVAAALEDEVSCGDLVARRGGDEFSVLVPGAVKRDLDELQTRLQDAIVRARTATCPKVTPSGAVSYVITRPGDELATLMERADRALHEAKVDSRARRTSEAPPQLSLPNAPPPVEAQAKHGASALHHEDADEIPSGHAPLSRGGAKAFSGVVASASAAWLYSAVLFALVALIVAALLHEADIA